MQPARISLFSSAFCFQSARSVLPFSSHLTTQGEKPACTQDAGFVPCAEAGIRSTLRSVCPFLRRYSRITTSPVYSPAAPEVGCNVQASNPVMAHNCSCNCSITDSYPATCSAGASGCGAIAAPYVIGIIAAAGFSFIVHEPSGIIDVARLISLRSRRLR